jgi:hypothetical protein
MEMLLVGSPDVRARVDRCLTWAFARNAPTALVHDFEF